jgi:hypothetical protein
VVQLEMSHVLIEGLMNVMMLEYPRDGLLSIEVIALIKCIHANSMEE